MKPEWLRITVKGAVAVIEFALSPTQNISHSEVEPAVNAAYNALKETKIEVALVTGRGPTWLYSAVVHAIAHLAKAVLVFDAVNKLYVVVAAHTPEYKIGQTIPPEQLS